MGEAGVGERGHENGLLRSRVRQRRAAATEQNKTGRTKVDVEKAPRPRGTFTLISDKQPKLRSTRTG